MCWSAQPQSLTDSSGCRFLTVGHLKNKKYKNKCRMCSHLLATFSSFSSYYLNIQQNLFLKLFHALVLSHATIVVIVRLYKVALEICQDVSSELSVTQINYLQHGFTWHLFIFKIRFAVSTIDKWSVKCMTACSNKNPSVLWLWM